MDREKEPCLRRSWIAFLPGGAKRGFSITAIALTELSFSRGGTKRKGRERERERRGTRRELHFLERVSRYLEQAGSLARKRYYREGKFSPYMPCRRASPLNRVLHETSFCKREGTKGSTKIKLDSFEIFSSAKENFLALIVESKRSGSRNFTLLNFSRRKRKRIGVPRIFVNRAQAVRTVSE